MESLRCLDRRKSQLVNSDGPKKSPNIVVVAHDLEDRFILLNVKDDSQPQTDADFPVSLGVNLAKAQS